MLVVVLLNADDANMYKRVVTIFAHCVTHLNSSYCCVAARSRNANWRENSCATLKEIEYKIVLPPLHFSKSSKQIPANGNVIFIY